MFTEDGVKLISQIKPEQNTLILRDISSKCSMEEIMNIFSNKAEEEVDVAIAATCCPAAKSVRSDMNDTW